MCGFCIRLLNLKDLTAAQKKAIKKELQRRKDALQAQINDLTKAIKKIK
jgi:hypothetical protein